MKIRKLIVIILGAIAICIPAYFLLMFWSVSNVKNTAEKYTADSATIMIDTITTPDIRVYNFSGSLPHYQYSKLEDSTNQVYERRKSKDVFFPISVEGSNNKIGLAYEKKHALSYYADSVMPFSDFHSPTDTAYYVSLPYYSLDWKYQLFREKGRTYIKYPVWDSSSQKPGHYEKKELSIALQETNSNEYTGIQKRSLHIPISKNTFGVLKILLKVSGILFVIIAILILFVLPILILQQIAKGKAFTKKTLRFLYIVSYGLLGLYLYGLIVFYMVRLFISSRIPSQFTYSTYEVFSADINYAFGAIFSFAFAIAFKKGYTLQQEQALTI